jgi:hypothetical protein
MGDATVWPMSESALISSARIQAFRESGIDVINGFFDGATVHKLTTLCEPLLASDRGKRPGVRRVFARQPEIAQTIANSPARQLMRDIGGAECRVVRAVLFDKSPETNWMVPWHQDATIALSERRDVHGFGPWAIKDSEHHCQPPLNILESIFTLRLHLDPCPHELGPLRVVHGSHTRGLLSDSQIREVAESGTLCEAVTDLGGVVLTTPLAVHGSSKAIAPAGRRRVLHLDCSPVALPGGLRWAEANDI